MKPLGSVGAVGPPNDQKGGFVGQFFLASRILVGQSLKVSFMYLFTIAFLHQLNIM